MKPEKSLQKLTHKKTKIEIIFSLKKVTQNDLDALTKAERKKVYELMYEKLNSIKGKERDKLVEQFNDVWGTDTKNQLWASNHVLISGTISNLLREYNRMPTISEVAERTELSRQTVHKHLQNYETNPMFLEYTEQYKILTPLLITKVYKLALSGDVGAAKLYFNLMGCLNNGQTTKNTLIHSQNNYIQINGTVLSQDTIKSLNPEQLNEIESILRTALQQPEDVELNTAKS